MRHVNNSLITMCENSSTPNLRGQDIDIVSTNLKKDKNEENNQSTDALLKELLDETKKMNKFLKYNNNYSMNINDIMLTFGAITVLCAVASIDIASMQLLADGDETGIIILYAISIIIAVLGIFVLIRIWDSRKKLKENT